MCAVFASTAAVSFWLSEFVFWRWCWQIVDQLLTKVANGSVHFELPDISYGYSGKITVTGASIKLGMMLSAYITSSLFIVCHLWTCRETWSDWSQHCCKIDHVYPAVMCPSVYIFSSPLLLSFLICRHFSWTSHESRYINLLLTLFQTDLVPLVFLQIKCKQMGMTPE